MKLYKSTLILTFIGSLGLAYGQQDTQDVAANTQMESAVSNWTETEPTIAGIASRNASFSTLVTALKAADLVTTLDGNGPFTVFAPTNDAFAKLPDGTVASLLESQNIPTLTKILTYHVISGEFKAADVVKAIQENNNAFVQRPA